MIRKGMQVLRLTHTNEPEAAPESVTLDADTFVTVGGLAMAAILMLEGRIPNPNPEGIAVAHLFEQRIGRDRWADFYGIVLASRRDALNKVLNNGS